MKIDVFSHIITAEYRDKLLRKAKGGPKTPLIPHYVTSNPPLCNLDIRLRLLDRYPDYKQVITTSLPALDDSVVSVDDAIELAKIANEELAELVTKYPDKFVAAAACLPVNDIDACVEEAERAITQLGHKGIQVFTKMNDVPITDKMFWPL
ncbi:amidohydrolase family protein, partial [Chloroflexota bacterium]